MRYVWDQFDAYFGPGRASLPVRAAARVVAPLLRRWDVASTERAHALVANSRFVSDRCLRFWGRAADAVVYPPVDLARFTVDRSRAEPFALIVSALVPYKRVDLAIRAFAKAGRALVVAGGGPELARLRDLARTVDESGRVQVLGPVDDATLLSLYQRCAFFVLPGEEDFGIAPVEAQGCGRPVLALGRGGALETVDTGTTGAFFEEPTIDSLLAALPGIDRLAKDQDPQAIRARALRFDAPRFGPEFSAVLARLRAEKAPR
jgi:glycosyltransferase involved in cell wall biosynthesis